MTGRPDDRGGRRVECGALLDHVEALSVALAHWATRDDAKAQLEVRQAANRAVESIDASLAELYQIREALAWEIREADDATMRRSGELLDRIRREREADR